MFSFVSWIVVAVCCFVVLANRGRIERLEKTIAAYKKRLIWLERHVPGDRPHSQDTQVSQSVVTSKQKQAPNVVYKPVEPYNDTPNILFSWVRENWLLVIGAVFILFAAGWLVRYSILHSIIGPVGRISIGLVLGVGVIGVAEKRIKTHVNQGSIFAVLGGAITLATLYAGQQLYHLFTPTTSMALMVLTVALVAILSVRYKVPRLSYTGLITAGLIPILVSTGNKDFIGLFSYLSLITVGTLWVVFLTGWRKNILISLVMVFVYSIPVFGNYYEWIDNEWVGLAYAFGFGIVFFLASLAANIKAKGKVVKIDLMTAMLLGGFLISWVLNVAPNEWQSLLFAGWALLFGGASYQIFLQIKEPKCFYVYSGVSLLLLVAATAVEFTGPVLTIVFIAESAILPFIVWHVLKKECFVVKASYFILLPLCCSLDSLGQRDWLNDTIPHAFVLSAITLVSFGIAYFLHQLKQQASKPVFGIVTAFRFCIAVATIYGGFFVWRMLHVLIPTTDASSILSLIIFMLFGLGNYSYGYLRKMKEAKIYGGIVIGWVSFRLIFIDMPEMEIGGKVVTFFILGTLLLSTAFLERRAKKAIK